jgi:FKBP-type peptidyl-prolyl cis-trans isomerase
LVVGLPLLLAGCQQPESKPEPTPPTVTQEEPKVTESAAVQAARKLGTPTDQPVVTTASGLQCIDVKEGSGAAAQAGDTVSVHYTGWLVEGAKFDSSLDRGQPFSFPLGAGRVIRGWDEGVAGMKSGGVRKLIIPSDLAYGPGGRPPVIPPNATLIFEVIYVGK